MSASGIRVRRAAPSDAERILELDRELARFEKLPPPDDDEGRRLLGWIFDSGRLEALVAELGDEVVGMALFYEGLGTFRARPFLYLEDLVVAKSSRGRGVGEALLASLAREAIARNALRIEWAVLDWNDGAIRMYERLGARKRTDWLHYGLDESEVRRLAAGRT